MAEKIQMTALSPTMEEGTIAAWSKSVGDQIASGDVLCEVETDKATMEYEAVQEGTLLAIVVEAGGTATVGQAIGVIGDKGEDIAALLAEIASEGSGSAAPSTPPAPPAEPRDEQPSQEAAPKPVAPPKPEVAAAAPERTAQVAAPRTSDGGRIKASPLAVKLAAERNINLALVSGTGTGGRITRRDIEGFRGVPGGRAVAAPPPGATSAQDEVIPVTGKRAVIARRLAESKFSAPHYYLKATANMDNVVSARTLLNSALPSKVSLNAFFIKIAAEALKRHPVVNSGWNGDSITQFGSIDIGIAVDLGNGLITPIVRNCGARGIVDIDGELKVLIDKAGEGKLKPDEYTGATFTISNLGSFGVDEFTAIINPPGAAILAIGATRQTPIVKPDGSFGVGNLMTMTLSCDHRVIDGAAGGRFLNDLRLTMEEPLRMLF